jgi:protocatechuate 3,4-dioxygenase beta subunit
MPVPIATADADGRFSFSTRALPGDYFAEADGRARSLTQTISRQDASAGPVRMMLPGRTGSVRGLVLDRARRPIPGAVVRVGARFTRRALSESGAAATEPSAGITWSDQNGAFRADDITAGRAELSVSAPGYCEKLESVEVSAASAVDVEVQLEKCAIVTGGVFDSAQRPCPDASVSSMNFGGSTSVTTRSAGDGAYRLEGVMPTEGRAKMEASGTAGVCDADIAVQHGQEARWDAVLTADSMVVGRVLDATGRPLAKWAVELVPKAGRFGLESQRIVLDDLGTFRFPTTDAGPYRILVFASGASLPTMVVDDVRPSSSRSFDIIVGDDAIKGCVLSGHIVGEGAVGSSPKLVVTNAEGNRATFVVPDSSGAFRIEVPSGEYIVRLNLTPVDDRYVTRMTVRAGDALDLGEIAVLPAGRVEVSVEGDERDANAAQLEVTQIDASGAVISGAFAVRRSIQTKVSLALGPGRYAVRIHRNGCQGGERIVAVESSKSVPLRFSLARAPQQTLRIPCGAGVRTVLVEIRAHNGELVSKGYSSRGPDGVVIAQANLLADNYSVVISTVDGEAARATATISVGGSPGSFEIPLR